MLPFSSSSSSRDRFVAQPPHLKQSGRLPRDIIRPLRTVSSSVAACFSIVMKFSSRSGRHGLRSTLPAFESHWDKSIDSTGVCKIIIEPCLPSTYFVSGGFLRSRIALFDSTYFQNSQTPMADFACGDETEFLLKSMRVESFKTLKLPNSHRFSAACGHGLKVQVCTTRHN